MEHIIVSGYVNFDVTNFSLVQALTNQFEDIRIKEGYLSATISTVTDTEMQLAIFGDGLIEDSMLYRNTLFSLSKLIDNQSSILIKEDPNEEWTSITTLKPKSSTIVAHKIHVPKNINI